MLTEVEKKHVGEKLFCVTEDVLALEHSTAFGDPEIMAQFAMARIYLVKANNMLIHSGRTQYDAYEELRITAAFGAGPSRERTQFEEWRRTPEGQAQVQEWKKQIDAEVANHPAESSLSF